jgi:hypothetical protein
MENNPLVLFLPALVDYCMYSILGSQKTGLVFHQSTYGTIDSDNDSKMD